MFSTINSLWRWIRTVFTNLWAMLFLGLGIALAGGGFGVAVWMSPLAIVPILISAAGALAGAFVIAGSLQRFVDTPRSGNGELEKKNQELEKTLKKVQKENEVLRHRVENFANVTKIQPVLKLVTGELIFDITDFCEKRLDDGKPEKHPLSHKLHENPEFYRGVYKYSGKMNLAADLAKIKIVETNDTITICGPFEYEPLLDLDHEAKWLMHGRREQEFCHGRSENDMETVEIRVTKVRDPKFEDEQTAALHENMKHLKIVDSMKAFTDKIVVEFVKLMLAPTGKRITYSPTANEAFSTKTLGELVTAYNSKTSAPLLPDLAQE